MTEASKPLVVVMGVSGSGKSTVGALLAESLGVPFIDADDLHPRSNVDKMAAGMPLNDDDRWPWLELVGRSLAERASSGAVVACSALRVSYRDAIRRKAPSTRFVLLEGSRDILAGRLAQRVDHFMPPNLLDSQLDALEPFGASERGVVIAITDPPSVVVARSAAMLEE